MSVKTVTIIIPTTCEARRWPTLNRAIDSLLSQSVAALEILVVVNGKRFDQDCLVQLNKRKDLRVVYLEQGSVTLAQHTGRTLVNSEYFGFLDDDDEYLLGSLARRLEALSNRPDVDFVACNGYRRREGAEDQLIVQDTAHIVTDAMAAMGHSNWLASCGGLFRTASVGKEFFNPGVQVLEWTYLAYALLSRGKKVYYMAEPEFVIHDTPASLSKSSEYHKGLIHTLRLIGRMPLPNQAKRLISRRLAAANHDLAHRHLGQGHLRQAWKRHVFSLVERGGMRYLSFTRHLLLEMTPFARKFKAKSVGAAPSNRHR